MTAVGRLPKYTTEGNEGAPPSANGVKRLWSMQRTSPPPRFLLVVLLSAQIVFLAIVRLGPSASVWGGQGAGRSVEAPSAEVFPVLSRSSVSMSGTSGESQELSKKESEVFSEQKATIREMSAEESEEMGNMARSDESKGSDGAIETVLKEWNRPSTEEETGNVAQLDKSKGTDSAIEAVSKEEQNRASTEGPFDELLPSVDEKFLADTSFKESPSTDAEANAGGNGRNDSQFEPSSLVMAEREGEQQEGSAEKDHTSYKGTASPRTRKSRSRRRAKRKRDRRNAVKTKQVVTEAESNQENRSESSVPSDKESPKVFSESEHEAPLLEKAKEDHMDPSVELRFEKQESQPTEEDSRNEVSMTEDVDQNAVKIKQVVAEAEAQAELDQETRSESFTSIDNEGNGDSSKEQEASPVEKLEEDEAQPVVTEEAKETATSILKVEEDEQHAREPQNASEKENGQDSASEDAMDVSVKEEMQPIATEQPRETAISITKVVEDEQHGEEPQDASEKESIQGSAKEEEGVVRQKAHEEGTSSGCRYGYLYVYDLPPAFNREIISNCSALNPWVDICATLSNGGLGERLGEASPLGQVGSWYASNPFTAEIIFHNRILQHACLTDKADAASAFYLPFYAGLDLGRYLISGTSIESRDGLSTQFVDWFIEQPTWKRSGGSDHFMMIGRNTWDFRRSQDEGWGSGLFSKSEIQKVTKLLLERNPWDNTEMAVPCPTNFHPQSDADLVAWQNHIRDLQRNNLFSFAGTPKDKFPDDFRHILFDQCKEAEQCQSLDCSNGVCNDNQKTLGLFMDSVFCLQPRGDTFTRRSTFDCLLAGSIPVFFWRRSAYMQYEWHLPADQGSYSVFISRQDVRNGTRIEDFLKAIAPEKVQSMQEAVIQLLPKVVYAVSGFALKQKDAFDLAIEGFMRNLNGPNVSFQR